jgi:DNA adenine methylase
MILRRLGNKKKVAKLIIPHFPPHKVYVEPFFGGGGMFFQKSKAKYNIVNDLDSDVFNLFQVVMNQKDELIKSFCMMPIHSDLLSYWKENEEVEPIMKALRFLLRSNFGYMGSPDTIHFALTNPKEMFLKNIENTFDFIGNVKFNNVDFRKFFQCWTVVRPKDNSKFFIYNDPPYQNTNDNYSNSFVKQDLIDLIETNIATGCKFAISEFDTDVVLELAALYNLEVITIGERKNLKSRRTEILIVNYKSPALNDLFSTII